MNTSLLLIVLRTPQLDLLKTFYQALGIDLVEEKHGKGPVHYSGKLGKTVLELYPGEVADVARLGFGVENPEEVLNAIRTLGGSVVTEPTETPWGLRAVVKDPDGRAVELYHGTE